MWPQWAKFYGVFVSVPMAFFSLGIVGWIIATSFGGLFEDVTGPGVIIMSAVFVIAFLFTAWLFAVSAQRLWTNQTEALIFSSTGHLMLAIPAIVFTMIGFMRNENVYVANLEESVESFELNWQASLVLWMVVHTYLALWLAMADNTSPLE